MLVMKKRIFIAEDDLDILFTINMMLENAGYEVELSSSGRYVVEGKYKYPDLFILDKRIPDMDGLEVCRQLRNRPECKNIPIIIISASPKFGDQALTAGANDFLEKPFEMNDLLKMVGKYTPDNNAIL
jgi:CheY-like chemotaxis protein